MPPASYLLCATPRTGSTLLCDLLTSTRVLGRPASYFREQDEMEWAQRLGVPADGGVVRELRDGGGSDIHILERALGRLVFVHLRREDALAQAVSWARAEQTGFWQRGDEVRRAPELDLQQVRSSLKPPLPRITLLGDSGSRASRSYRSRSPTNGWLQTHGTWWSGSPSTWA